MLAQLLDKHGLKARVVPHEDVARTRIAALDVAGVAMMCISFISVGGSTARLRYLLRRRRERQPAARQLLGSVVGTGYKPRRWRSAPYPSSLSDWSLADLALQR